MQHLPGFDAGEVLPVVRGEIGDARAQVRAGIPDDGIAEAVLLDGEAMPAVEQRQWGDHVAVDAIGLAGEADVVVMLAVQPLLRHRATIKK